MWNKCFRWIHGLCVVLSLVYLAAYFRTAGFAVSDIPASSLTLFLYTFGVSSCLFAYTWFGGRPGKAVCSAVGYSICVYALVQWTEQLWKYHLDNRTLMISLGIVAALCFAFRPSVYVVSGFLLGFYAVSFYVAWLWSESIVKIAPGASVDYGFIRGFSYFGFQRSAEFLWVPLGCAIAVELVNRIRNHLVRRMDLPTDRVRA